MKYAYPAIFTPEEVSGRGIVYTVEFPDVFGCVTEGESIAEAIAMAREALAGCLLVMKQSKENIPSPSDITIFKLEQNQFTSIVDLDLNEYLRKKEKKAVIKTVSLPQWLDIMAEEAGISYSQILQKALKKELSIAE
jgi:predicted RNase H-like HicB family nuclease